MDASFKQPTTSQWDLAEAATLRSKAVTTGSSDSFSRVCKNLGLPQELHSLYRTWFIQCGRSIYNGTVTPDIVPVTKGSHGQVPKLPAGWRFPYPSGSAWRRLKATQATIQHAECNGSVMLATIMREMSDQKHSVRTTHQYAFSARVSDSVINAFQAIGRKKKRGANDNAPQSVQKALERENGNEWADSMDKEVNGLTEKGVVLHDQTMQMCRDEGINSTPVPIGIYFKEKTDQFGKVTQLKSRAAIQGHKGNMQRGTHFFETYAATPQEDTARILICLAVLFNLVRRSWDVEKAYCCAPIPPSERIILRYPQGFRRFHKLTNEELFMILMMNLYGDPAAGRRWSNHRDNQLLEQFNSEFWTCKRCIMDPTLFFLTWTAPDKTKHFMILSMHTDDFDAVGSHDVIFDEFNRIVNTFWTLIATDVSYMLGWQRIPVYSDDKRLLSITLTMTAYVKGMANAFRDRLPKRNVSEPFNPKSRVCKDMEVDPDESKLVLEAGYLKGVGLVLWAVRHSFPEGKFGISILGSVAYKSSWLAFEDLMWMIKWIEQNQDRGIRFSADGNPVPFGMADASNKPVMSTGLCQGGYCLMWMNGPVASASLRMHHVGLSSTHNEYMAMHMLIKRIMWLRQLLAELGYNDIIKAPTKCFGDNIQANKLCKEHFISPGNQYIATQYHFNKEKVASGDVEILWINTKNNLADIFTKALTKQTFDLLLNYLLGYAGNINKLFEATQLILHEMKDHPSLR